MEWGILFLESTNFFMKSSLFGFGFHVFSPDLAICLDWDKEFKHLDLIQSMQREYGLYQA
jgi:hypothetical protein